MDKDPINVDAQSPASSPAFSDTALRLILGLFGFAFAGCGIAVLRMLWLPPANRFDLFDVVSKIIFSISALVFFLAFGVVLLFLAIFCKFGPATRADFDKFNQTEAEGLPNDSAAPSSPVNYSCSHCGATLMNQADVLPLGDVKCSFCHKWFNIHRPTSGT